MNRFLFPALSKKRQYLYSVAFIIVISIICFGLSAWMGYRVVAFILLLSVSLLAIIFEILPVLVAATLSAFIWNFFFIPPRFTMHVDNTEDGILLIMYFVIAIINGVLTYKIRQIEKIARLKEEKANSVKLYNTILNSLSHELRTPIAAITAATDNLQSNTFLTNDHKEELIGEISKAALRLNAQVENLLNISRLESGHIQPKYDWCDIVELVFATVKTVEENNAGRKIAIHVNPDLPLCKTDKGMLEQVIYNLLNNAAIHTAKDRQISIAASCHADQLQFIIEDNGQGFTPVAMKEVFDKLSRYKNAASGGSGLGLSIVKGFTDALNGTVELEKPQDGGTRFILCFPVETSKLIMPSHE